MEKSLKNLIIVESPTKAKTIKNFLGKNYTVVASKGHIRDLPKSSFGIKIDNQTFIPEYRVPKDHASVVKEIKELAKEADQVYIATDEDREGEAIGFHIATAIGKDPKSLPRIVFHEITKNAITHALENPRILDESSINAQQARRLLDRIVGYKLSPLLSSKIQKGLSAGRVQSSTLKIVVDREKEIRAFKEEEFWSIDALFNKTIEASLVEFEGEKIEKMSIGNQERAYAIKEKLLKEAFHVALLEKKERESSPSPAFMTSTLQQSASSALGYSPKKTMMLAQTLYEGVKTHQGVQGVITYMRTDSLNVSKEAIEAAREQILSQYGKTYLPEKARFYANKSKGAQEAHEAIRPTILEFTPAIASAYLAPDELKLYALIYNRFLASQMNNARFESQTLIFESQSGKFKASGRKLLFDGFYKVYGDNDKDKLLPDLALKQEVTLSKLDANQHFTEPPSRYSEASLIKKLESLGIGRPSTYAPTISVLSARDYINIEKKQIVPTEVAFQVTELLEQHFPQIVDSSFTSTMEERLDLIAEDKEDWQAILWNFYEPFDAQVAKGKTEIQSQKVIVFTGEMCPECGKELVRRKGRFGEFIACSTYPTCKYTQNLKKVSESAPKEKVTLSVPCPECGGEIIERSSRRGKFFGCGNYPKCKFISNYEPTDKKCPECGYIMAKRELRKKEIYECIKCKHKEEA
ncbi:type I DNA topoisomerase [Sulfurospirillum deleyianum]|uniref:DNA topoisomerase 1 n=1 Tax=Sulfurospirillum deleyianum (strain ATCC 51133 / DSM 6946 / 5175) TaxID=525898 RepID=D1B572_SULD5|nr:type I DNA topoisomerase [Sulfurospirillum deleyianum]ACZ13242.1 DNA topoisomerase I [Sulfurospirillum deleyianum DSM 6946]